MVGAVCLEHHSMGDPDIFQSALAMQIRKERHFRKHGSVSDHVFPSF